jgi:hypothetical protein
MFVRVFLCCVVLCRWRPCDGLITRPRSPTICLNSSRNHLYVRRPGSKRTVEPQKKKRRWVQTMQLLIMQFSSFLFGPNILLTTLFSNTLNLCSYLNVRDQVSLSYKKGEIIVLYVLIALYNTKPNSKQLESLHLRSTVCEIDTPGNINMKVYIQNHDYVNCSSILQHLINRRSGMSWSKYVKHSSEGIKWIRKRRTILCGLSD